MISTKICDVISEGYEEINSILTTQQIERKSKNRHIHCHIYDSFKESDNEEQPRYPK